MLPTVPCPLAGSQPEAAADALNAGADIALGGGCGPEPPGCVSFGALPEALTMGLTTEVGEVVGAGDGFVA